MPAATDPPQKATKFWALVVPDRKKATLIPILKYKIRPESIVWSDGWASYFTLGSHFKDWDYVNHKNFFKDPNTGVNTNRQEGSWKWMKETIPDGTSRTKIDEYVHLHCFKEWIKNHKDIDTLGLFGLLGRANACVTLSDKGGKGDDILNLSTAQDIVSQNPLPEPPAPPPNVGVRGRVRPPKTHRGRRPKVQEI